MLLDMGTDPGNWSNVDRKSIHHWNTPIYGGIYVYFLLIKTIKMFHIVHRAGIEL